ncbi:MAG: hypothetical protein QOF68_309, partial [Gaiellales bacterium]|nr:hypothetical protein [Gaiellales bacterium]
NQGWSAVGPAVIEGELTTVLVGIDETVTAGRFGELRIAVNRDAWNRVRPRVAAGGASA